MNARRVLEAVYAAAIVSAIAPQLTNAQSSGMPASAKTVRDEALRRELLQMTEEDQKVRIETMQELADAGVPIGSGADASNPKFAAIMKKVAARLNAVDETNRARLKEIVNEHGWPGVSLVGKDGAHAAWLLVQHSDEDREFQKACLARMETLPDGEVKIQAIAYLTDRVLVGEKKPQRYGTQMGNDFLPAPIEDPENVDRRRAEVGLPPLAEYIEMAKVGYQELSTGSKRTDKEREN